MPAHYWETASCPHSDLFIALKNYQINKYKLVAEAQQPEGCIKSLKNENTKEHNDYSSMRIYLKSFVKYMHALNIANNVLGLLEKCFAWYNIMINHALISQHRIFQKLTRGIRNLKKYHWYFPCVRSCKPCFAWTGLCMIFETYHFLPVVQSIYYTCIQYMNHHDALVITWCF